MHGLRLRLAGSIAVALFALSFSAIAVENSEPDPTRDQRKYPARNEERSASGSGPSATFTVSPGQSIQDAIDRARPGDQVQLLPGVYHEAVTVDFDDISLIGVIENGRRPVLDGKGELNDAVLASGHNFTMQGIEMRNYKANGVVVNQAKNCTFRDLVGVNTGKYAVYPVQCDGVLIEDCVVTDVWDAGIYAGQCKNVEIRNCTTYRNTIGIEAENSENVLIHNNTSFNNTLGILVVLLPNLPSKVASDALVINNRVLNNNYPNLAPAGNIVSFVQPGAGIMVSAADHTEVTGNDVTGNGSFGIVMSALTDSASLETEDGGESSDRLTKIDVEPNPDFNHIHHNRFDNNGNGELAPQYKAFGLTEGGDLLWTGKGQGNVWDEATDRSFPAQLPGPGAVPAGAGGGI